MKLRLSDVSFHTGHTSGSVSAYVGRQRRFKKTEHVGRCVRPRRAAVVRMNFTVRAANSPSDMLSFASSNGARSPGSTEFSSSGDGTYDIVEEKATIKVGL